MLTDKARVSVRPGSGAAWTRKMLGVEWLGQTLASICWICSVFAYGIGSVGDWLQLCAASAWLLANFASVISTRE